MRKQITKQVKGMTVAQMRKEASQYGVKNAKQYKRVELEKMLIDAMVKVAEANKKASKKSTKVSTDKRYKAETLVATKEEIEQMAGEVIDGIHNKEIKREDLFGVNRKVLIVVMKMLKCAKWYRTYGKQVMVEKIVTAA